MSKHLTLLATQPTFSQQNLQNHMGLAQASPRMLACWENVGYLASIFKVNTEGTYRVLLAKMLANCWLLTNRVKAPTGKPYKIFVGLLANF